MGGRAGSSADPRDDVAPLFTVVTAVFNAASTLERTIASVQGQMFCGVEHIIIDGGSTDGTLPILRKHDDDVEYWMSEPDRGIYDAWNKGVALARGPWISFLGAGDRYRSGGLEAYANLARSQSETGLQYISSRVDLERNGCVTGTIGRPWRWAQFARYMTVAHVGSFHHKSLFEQLGFFDASYHVCGDYELLLRARDGLQAAFVDKVTAVMPLGGVSNTNVGLALAETARAKSTSGGRAGWRCSLEKHDAYARAKLRSLLEARVR